ncbi:MAG: F0F1 ATP synthase subunit delta [bacterium]|nr:F0F1 ATP synthase subunit delta [bacterium]
MAHEFGKVGMKYARALFESVEPSQLESFSIALATLSAVWESSIEIRAALLNPAISFEQKDKIAQQIAEVIKPGDKTISNFISLLSESKRASLIPEIALQFEALVNELKKSLSLEITSAFLLSADEKAEYEDKIKKDFGSLAKVEWKVDASIIGGMVIKSGDRLIDSSIKGSLERATNQLLA